MHILPWDLTVIPSKFFLFAEAAQYTLQITFFGILLGLMIGLTAALGRLSHRSWLSALCRSYIFLVRGNPLLVQLFIVYYGLTSLVTIAPIPSAVLALGFHNGAYIAEIFRGSIQSIIALKDSSLASTIAVPELMLKGRQMGSSSFMYMEMFLIVGIWYLIMTSVLSFVMHRIEQRLKVSDRD